MQQYSIKVQDTRGQVRAYLDRLDSDLESP